MIFTASNPIEKRLEIVITIGERVINKYKGLRKVSFLYIPAINKRDACIAGGDRKTMYLRRITFRLGILP